tara:strand:+ start:434 stop:835 length:402 start_codon:yes stop_codon:yes gene_type:complete
MAGISGVNGNIAITNAIGGIIKSWTANFTRASTDITGFTNATRNRAVGIIDVTGSMTGSLDNATSPTVAFSGNTSAADITLTAESGNTLQFKAIIDSFTVGVAVDGEATFSANFAIASTATTFGSAVTTTWTT